MGNKRSRSTHLPENLNGLRRLPTQLSKLCLGGALAAVALPGQAQQQLPLQPLEEIVTIGTRMQGRTATDTAVPVDVVSAEELKTVPAADISDIISRLIPSFDITANPVNDGSSHIRPSQMRGMDFDKALVLVNGKRRHRAAVVFLDGWGAHGPDLNPIPAIALNSVEVLRDGASALYGSDAIAGVMNFNLKDAGDGGSISVMGGQYAGHDHEGEYQVAANKGLALGDSGFVNVSVEWAKRERADRGTVYNFPIAGSGVLPSDAVNTVMENAVSVDGIALGTRYGPDALTERDFNGDGVIDSLVRGSDGIPDDPDTRFKDNLAIPEQAWGATPQESKKLFINAGYKLTEDMQLYAFGNYMSKQSDSSFYYRSPSASQLAPVRRQDGSIYNPRAELYPGGFTPRFYGDVEDYSLAAGLRGQFSNGIFYDFNGRYGNSNIGYDVKGSMNPSMGPDTPTNFHAGELQSDEMSFNADLSKPVEIGWHSPLNVAVGFEYRDEGYKISKGEPLSYFAGPYALSDPWNFEITQAEVDANPTDSLTQIECRIPGLAAIGSLCPAGDPIRNAAAVGSNGFPGYDPNFTADYNRSNSAAYLTLESDVTEKFFGSVSGRFEDFEDFGSNFSWRTAGRYRLTDGLALRASVGTGFKAPTPGQISTINVSTRVINQNLVQSGIFPATHPASMLFGAKPLEPETSFSYTGGITFEPLDTLSIALDYYYIELKDRITFSGIFTPTQAQQAQLAQFNIPGGEAIQGVQFFTNDADTETTGIDLVVDYHLAWDSAGVTTFTYRGNWNQTDIVRRPIQPDGSTLVSDARKYGIEHAPRYRGAFGVNHAWDRLSVDVRLNSYGAWSTSDNALAQFQSFSSTQQVDLSLGWKVNESISATLGGRNVFDAYPDEDNVTTCCGQKYPEVAADWFGVFWYLNVSANF
jgi:iron complex outermembrane recepter protein